MRQKLICSNIVAFVVAYLGACYCVDANAGLPYPGTWSSESDDGKYLFVMLSPEPIADEVLHSNDEEIDEEIQFIRATYPKSGLYLANGPSHLVWEYTGEWPGNSVIIAPDGEYLIFPGAWTLDEYQSRVVEFTRRGQSIRKYFDVEIIPQYLLKWLLNGLSRPVCSKTSFNPQRMTYSVSTNQGDEITFDVTTGKVIAINSPFPTLYMVAGVAIATLVIAGAGWRRRINRRAIA